MLFPLCVITIFFTFLSGTDKVRIPGLGLDPDHSAKNGPEKVRNWAQGPDLEHQEGIVAKSVFASGSLFFEAEFS